MSYENITVKELGEDSDLWIVTGTTDAHTADEAVRQWFESNTGETIEAFQDADDLVEFEIKFREDWAWIAGSDPENPFDEAELVSPSNEQGTYKQEPFDGPFAGFLVRA